MQHIKFALVEDFLEFLPESEKQMVNLLRGLILQCIPECIEKLSYNVPYYYRKRRVCFIWPASIPWGNVKLEGVQLGFCYGNLLEDDINYLERGYRKQVYVKTFFKPSEINQELVRSYLHQAVEIDGLLK